MQDFIGSVRRSLVFKPNEDTVGGSYGGFVKKIGSSIRKSKIGLFSKALPLPPNAREDEAGSQIRWQKGELIGCGAFGRVYMGMNLDSGELLAVKQVSVVVNLASKDKTQAHIRELEEEVKLLKNLSHPNIVRYLGTGREESSLNIFLEFVPGGSISSLLGKFGSFPESVIRMYTKQLLLGLEYLHKNGIMHRDIKGANILVDNKGQIKLADFGASKKVVELATMTGAKSMKGTPYWMAPEVILQTGHSFSADIWSVGCTIIEMATGKPPWSQQYQEVAALFHIGTTKAHPPIPDHLSADAKDFLLKCLQKEPDLRPNASELLQHPFVTSEYNETHPVFRTSVMVKDAPSSQTTSRKEPRNLISPEIKTNGGMVDTHDMNSVRCSTIYPEKFSGGPMWGSSRYDDDMCQMDDDDDLIAGKSMKFDSTSLTNDINKSYNPMMEPDDDWHCQFDGSPEVGSNAATNLFPDPVSEITAETPIELDNDGFTFPNGASGIEEDEEVTEEKIRAFIDEKALDLKKMQTPLYEEFYNSLNASISPVGIVNKENSSTNLNLPPKSKSPNSNRLFKRRLSSAVDVSYISSPGNKSERRVSYINDQNPHESRSPQHGQMNENVLESQKDAISPSASFSERQRRWKDELAEELERKRELMRQAGVVKTSSPKDRMINNRQTRFGFLGN
ncbi:mitogen-activated protein kinase kinase kinase NPK1-like [Bidens hawaiensis]|uniref:mitogen-activated protein kinase kinase kinase NPK1-like n=1 Tax=Bidens hawaiensis TaxID=980011 RepID=UPI004049E7F0